jgi:hypothetical protein
VSTLSGSCALFDGRLEDAVEWYQRAQAAAADDPSQRLLAASTELLPRAYGGDPTTAEHADRVLAEAGDRSNFHAAYAWFCAGEAMLWTDPALARARFVRALELAELAGASFVAGVAGASKASIEARCGDPSVAADDYRRLIAHWRRAGIWSTQWTMLRSIAGLLARLERPLEAARLLGAVRATQAGHRIFGADEAALDQLESQLRATLGDTAYDGEFRAGATLDGDDAVELALGALSSA